MQEAIKKIKEIEEEIETARAVGAAIDEILTTPLNIVISKPKINDNEDNKQENIERQNTEVFKKTITTEDLKKTEIKNIIKERAKQKLEENYENVSLFDLDIEKKIEIAIAPLVEQKIKYTIDIPDIAVVQVGIQLKIYNDFDLNTHWFDYDVPTDEILIENLSDNEFSVLKEDSPFILQDTIQNIIVNEILITPLYNFNIIQFLKKSAV